jgi:hypothetical protein
MSTTRRRLPRPPWQAVVYGVALLVFLFTATEILNVR